MRRLALREVAALMREEAEVQAQTRMRHVQSLQRQLGVLVDGTVEVETFLERARAQAGQVVHGDGPCACARLRGLQSLPSDCVLSHAVCDMLAVNAHMQPARELTRQKGGRAAQQRCGSARRRSGCAACRRGSRCIGASG